MGSAKSKADRQAIRSGESSVKLNEESFKVGTRTIIDVLDSVTMLTQAQRLHAQDQYAYLLATIGLKLAAGTLSAADLNDINQWLIQSEAAAKKAASPVDDDKATAPMHLPKTKGTYATTTPVYLYNHAHKSHNHTQKACYIKDSCNPTNYNCITQNR